MVLPLPARWTDDRTLARLAWTAWALLVVALSAYMAQRLVREPDMALINEHYETGSHKWWGRESLYAPFTFHGFLYFPSAAVLYTPFTWGPFVLRHVLVRVAFTGCLLAGLSAVAGVGDPRRRGTRFALLTLTTLPLAVQNFRQGQMNLPYVGGMLLATAALAQRRFNLSSVALGLTLALKPLVVVLVGLVGAAFPRTLAWRLALAALLVALMPFAFAPPDYAWSQWVEFVHKMRVSSAPGTHNYELRGLLSTGLGLDVPQSIMTVIRVAIGFCVLAFVLVLRRRHDLPALAFHIYTLAACYLMLCNPKNEDPSYLVLAPAIGFFLIRAVLDERRRVAACCLALLPLLIALSWEIWGGRQYWFRPALALAFLAYVVVTLLRRDVPTPAGARRMARA